MHDTEYRAIYFGSCSHISLAVSPPALIYTLMSVSSQTIYGFYSLQAEISTDSDAHWPLTPDLWGTPRGLSGSCNRGAHRGTRRVKLSYSNPMTSIIWYEYAVYHMTSQHIRANTAMTGNVEICSLFSGSIALIHRIIAKELRI